MANFTEKDVLYTQLWKAGEAAEMALDKMDEVDFDSPEYEILKIRYECLERRCKEIRNNLITKYGKVSGGRLLTNKELGVASDEVVIFCDFCEADI